MATTTAPPGLVLNSDERALATAVRDVLDDLAPPEKRRTWLEDDRGFDDGAWRALAVDVGLAGLTVPEQYGGLGLGSSAAAAVYAELGRALYSGPFLSTALAVAALTAARDADGGGDDAGAARWLPAIGVGDVVATVALADARGEWDAAAVRAERAGGGWVVSGSRHFVIAGHVADLVLVVARTGSDDGLFAVDTALAATRARPMNGLDLTRWLATVEFQDCPATLIGGPESVAEVLAAVGRHLRLASAAEAGGGLAWCLETCTSYAANRQQFGRVIGSYQAVAHGLVDMLGAQRAVAAAARWAAVAADTGEADAELAGHVAALRAGEAYRVQTEAGIHLLGGIGFTWEHDMHLHYRRARAQAALAGGAARHRRAIACLSGL